MKKKNQKLQEFGLHPNNIHKSKRTIKCFYNGTNQMASNNNVTRDDIYCINIEVDQDISKANAYQDNLRT